MGKEIALLALVHLTAMSTPGPTAFLVIRNSGTGGRMDGYATAFGAASATLIHVMIGILGLGSLILAFGPLRLGVRYAGAGYLTYLGMRSLRAYTSTNQVNTSTDERTTTVPERLFTRYRQGLFTTVFNPKVILFYVSLFGQFLGPATPQRWTYVFATQFVLQALLFWALLSTVMASGALRPVWERWSNAAECVFGVVMIGFGLALFLH